MSETEERVSMKVNKISYDALLGMYTKDSENSRILFEVQEKKRSKEEFRERLIADAQKYFKDDNPEELADAIINNVLGYNVLTELLVDKDITDIKLYDYNHITIKKRGKRYQSDVKFDSEEDYDRFINGVITRNRVNASTQNAIQRFVDNTSIEGCKLRFTLYTKFLTSDEKYKLVIRKGLVDFPEIDTLVKDKMLTPEMADFLIEAWERGSILIVGANASGKTTLLNALKEKIPHDRSVLVIQQADELATKGHPDMLFLNSFEGSGENAVRYDLKDLSIAGLTSDVDVFIIGEIKGAEASYLLNASYTGSICAGTLHSNSSTTALDKLVDYALYTSTYTKQELLVMLTSFKTIVFMKDYKVREISEVRGIDKENGKVIYEAIYRG